MCPRWEYEQFTTIFALLCHNFLMSIKVRKFKRLASAILWRSLGGWVLTVAALPKSETRKRKRMASPKLSVRKRKANGYFKLAVIEESESQMVPELQPHEFHGSICCLACLPVGTYIYIYIERERERYALNQASLYRPSTPSQCSQILCFLVHFLGEAGTNLK